MPLLVLCLASCSRKIPTNCRVEVSRGSYLTVQKFDDGTSAQLTFQHEGRTITWKGTDIPVSLRLMGNRFYIIGYDQPADIAHIAKEIKHGESPPPKLFHYYRQEGNSFVAIPTASYPPKLAYQNMWYQESELEALRSRDFKSPDFVHSLVPLIWADILDEYREGYPVKDLEMLERFVRLHEPELLTFSPP